MRSLASLAAEECHVSDKWVAEALRAGPANVKKLKIPKRNGTGHRVISRPSAQLEILQRWLTIRFFNRLRVHDSAMAYVPGKSILSNANRHRSGNYFVRIDFKDFFPSIKKQDLIRALPREAGNDNLTNYAAYYEFLERICFDSNYRLPIGYISSPVISNVVMYEFDQQVTELVSLRQAELGKSRITRYADDIVFSTDKKGACQLFYEIFTEFVNSRTYPQLQINTAKTFFSSRSGGSAIVTGLRVCADGHVTINRSHKDAIRLMLSLHAKGRLKPEDFPVLRGHLAYVRHVSPKFFSNLCLRFIGVIAPFL